MGSPQRMVVGYDGSPEASAALRYAAARVGGDGVVIAVYADPPRQDISAAIDAGRAAPMPMPPPMSTGCRSRRLHGIGPAARVLVEIADEQSADEIVVGSRGHGALRAILGSVSHALLHESDWPVVIVRAKASEQPTG